MNLRHETQLTGGGMKLFVTLNKAGKFVKAFYAPDAQVAYDHLMPAFESEGAVGQQIGTNSYLIMSREGRVLQEVFAYEPDTFGSVATRLAA
jgi:hypothetical protein